MPTSARAVAQHYDGLLDGFVLDEADAASPIHRSACLATRTLMASEDDNKLAAEVLAFARRLGARAG